jgi:predicted dehydrogenase
MMRRQKKFLILTYVVYLLLAGFQSQASPLGLTGFSSFNYLTNIYASRPRAILWLIGGLGQLSRQSITPILEKHLASHPDLLKTTLILSIDKDIKDLERQKNLNRQKKIGIHVVNMDSLEGEKILYYCSPTFVFAQTPSHCHLESIQKILSFDHSSLKAIILEKPLAETKEGLDAIKNLKTKTAILGFDFNYCPLLFGPYHQEITQEVLAKTGKIKRIDYVWIENNGKDDVSRKDLIEGENPIAREGTATSLQSGITIDMLPHFPPLIAGLVDFNSYQKLLRIEAYQFSNKELPVKSETASYSQWLFQSKFDADTLIPTHAYVGKGISGSSSLHRLNQPIQSLFLYGEKNTLEWNYTKKTIRVLKGSAARQPIEDPLEWAIHLQMPYEIFLKSLLNGGKELTDILMPLDICSQQFHLVLSVKQAITLYYQNRALTNYPLGTENRSGPTFEQVFSKHPAGFQTFDNTYQKN